MVENNFREFHSGFVQLFRFFGLVPIYFTDAAKNILKLKPLYIGFISCFLGVYWTGVVFAFLISHPLSNKISIISNWIQMLVNAMALTTTLVCTAKKYKDLDMILNQFEKIDYSLSSIGQKVNYAKQVMQAKLIVLTFVTCLCFVHGFGYYVTVHLYEIIPIWYWLVSIVPICLYSMGLLQAMFMIFWIKCRCNLINRSLKEIISKTNSNLMISPTSSTVSGDNEQGVGINLSPSEKTRVIGHLIQKDSTNLMDNDRKILEKLFAILNDLCVLAKQIDNLFGLIFLATIGALFTLTTIQVYYCYVTMIKFDDDPESSAWKIFVGISKALLNLSLIIGLTSVCDSVTNEAQMIWQNFNALQIQKGIPVINELSIWIHSIVSNMKFSAFRFFTIDYTMLGGFVAALVTYLVIFIQFYSISDDRDYEYSFDAPT